MNDDINFLNSFVKNLKKLFIGKKIFLHEPFIDKKDIKTVSACLNLREISTSTNSF